MLEVEKRFRNVIYTVSGHVTEPRECPLQRHKGGSITTSETHNSYQA